MNPLNMPATLRCGACNLAQFSQVKVGQYRKKCVRCKAYFAAVLVEDQAILSTPHQPPPQPRPCSLCRLQLPDLPTMDQMKAYLIAEAMERTGSPLEAAKMLKIGKPPSIDILIPLTRRIPHNTVTALPVPEFAGMAGRTQVNQPKYTHEELKMTLLTACQRLMRDTTAEGIDRLLQIGANAGMTFTDTQMATIKVKLILERPPTLISPQGEPGAPREGADCEPVSAAPKDEKIAEASTPAEAMAQSPSDGNSRPLPENNEGERSDG